MDIAHEVLLAVALIAVAFTVGFVFADRNHRKQALTDLEAGELRVRELVVKINGAHNTLVGQVAEQGTKLESLGNRVAAGQAAKAPSNANSPFASRTKTTPG